MLTELECLEGWLIKKKRADKVSYFGVDTKRWFKMQKLKGSSVDELALCYFTNNTDKEPKGWIYLKDVRELSDDGRIMTITTPSRKMVIEAHSRAEHRLWLQGLIDYCPFLTSVSGIQSEINLRKYGKPKQKDEEKSQNQPAYLGAVDAKGVPCEQRERAFSRFANQSPNVSGEVPANVDPREVDYDYDRQLAPTNSLGRRVPSRNSFNREREHMDSAGSRRSQASYDDNDDLCHGGVQYNNSRDRRNPDGNPNSRAARERTDSRTERSMGSNYGGSTTSRLHSHISRNVSGGNLSNQDRMDSVGDAIDTDYDSLAVDKLESTRIRLNRYANDIEDDVVGDRDSDSSAGMRPLADDINKSLRENEERDSNNQYADAKDSSATVVAPTPVAHFATSSGISLSSSRELKLSVDDIITRSSANTAEGSGRMKAPPTAAYSPKIMLDDEDDIDIQAEKLRFNSSGADSKDVENGGTCRNHSAGDDKMSSSRSGSRPPLGPSPSLGHSSHDLNQHGIGKAPPPGAPPTMYRASSTSPKALVDSRFKDRTNMNADQNFASDNWDDDDSPVKSKVMSSNSNGYAMNHSRSQSNSSMNSSPGCGPTMHTHLNPSADAGSKNLSRSSSFNSHAGVKEDSNWINEDFDD